LTEPSNACHSAHALGTNCNLYLGLEGFSDGIDVNFNALRTLVHAREHGAMQVLI
jgi:hypothetical protein